MDAAFWHERWADNRIAFHEEEGNARFRAHFTDLALPDGPRVFVPLSGKTRDIGWLRAIGCDVVAAELSALAVDQLFDELQITPEVTRDGPLTRYTASRLAVFVGDVFDMTSTQAGALDAVYDRAALVALPAAMRPAYAEHIARLAGPAPQLLLTLEYDQTRMDGPPFSVGEAEVRRLYSAQYEIRELSRSEVPGGLRGVQPVTEIAWLLTRS